MLKVPGAYEKKKLVCELVYGRCPKDSVVVIVPLVRHWVREGEGQGEGEGEGPA